MNNPTDIFIAYKLYSQQILSEDKKLVEYEKDLSEKTQYVRNLTTMIDGLTVLTHPIRLVKTIKEKRRLKDISDRYYELKESPLAYHFDEESGEIDVDLRNAAEKFKPTRMRAFTELNPIYHKEDERMLKMK